MKLFYRFIGIIEVPLLATLLAVMNYQEGSFTLFVAFAGLGFLRLIVNYLDDRHDQQQVNKISPQRVYTKTKTRR